MFAKNLENLLVYLCRRSDLSPVNHMDMAVRFEALRGCAKLPRSRENRSRHLSDREIVAAILGLVPSNPEWAGHAAIVLGDLRPVGGPGVTPQRVANLSSAMERLLANDDERRCLLSLVLSAAEDGKNSNGFARLAWQHADGRQQVSFVSKMAVSRLRPGAESAVDADRYYAPASTCTVLDRRFFDDVAAAVAGSLRSVAPPAGDGSEYDAEEARQARWRALGVEPSSRFLTIGVDTQVTWPKQKVLVRFDRYDLVLMPKTREHTQSVHIDLHRHRLRHEQGITVINRFLSLLSWCDDQFAMAQRAWSGNPVPVPVARRSLAFATAEMWPFDRQIPASVEVRRALALYREGRNAEEAGLASYAVLSYFKIIEIRYGDGPKARRWIAGSFALVAPDPDRDAQMQHFMAACGDSTPEDYIYKACRVAVAHVSEEHPSDADDAEEITRLYTASHVLRLLARHFMTRELGISESTYSGD